MNYFLSTPKVYVLLFVASPIHATTAQFGRIVNLIVDIINRNIHDLKMICKIIVN